MKNKIIKVVLLIAVILTQAGLGFALKNDIHPAPDYLVILVHGIAAKGNTFGHGDIATNNEDTGDLQYYLENNLGLKGYIYSYSFADALGSSIAHARELGDRNYYTDNPTALRFTDVDGNALSKVPWNSECIIEYARKEFIVDFATRRGRQPTQNEIPKKIVIVCHSMGGLATRYYLTSDFYENDIKKIVFLDTPHIGADGIVWYERFKQDKGVIRSIHSQMMDYGMRLALKSILSSFGNPSLEDMYVSSAFMSIDGMSNALSDGINVISNFADKKYINGIEGVGATLYDAGFSHYSKEKWLALDYAKQEALSLYLWIAQFQPKEGLGLDEMNPYSNFLYALKGATPHPNPRTATIDQPEYRLVSARGCPTPHRDLIRQYYGLNPYAIGLMLPYLDSYGSLPSEGAKVYSALTSLAAPGAFLVKDGSLLVPVDSSRGEGVEIFKNSNVKKYDYQFNFTNLEDTARYCRDLNDAILISYWAAVALGMPYEPNVLNNWLMAPKLILSSTSRVGLLLDPSVLYSHNNIIKKVYDEGSPTIIEQTLFDSPIVTFASLHTDIDREKYNTTQVIEHTSSIEAVEIKNLAEVTTVGDYYRSVPYMTSEAETYLPYVTVTVPPTQLRGRIYDFKPQMLQRLELSENFAGWQVFKPIEKTPDSAGNLTATAGKFHLVIDQYGYFTLSGFDFYEGQNVVAFKTTNKIGIQTVQHLKVTLNTIPQWPSQFTPLYLTNNAAPAIGCEFNKAGYSSNESERINILSFKIDGVDLPLSDITINKYRNDYAMKTTVSYQPPTPLTEGEHQVMVLANSNIGTSQAIWPFTVDLTGPTISVEAPAQYSPVAANGEPMLIKYQVADQSPFIKNLSFQLYRGAAVDENFVSVITTVPTQAAGESFIKWNGAVPDGEYTLKVKGYDEAGNYTIVTVLIAIDATPPTITDQQIAPNPMTSNSQLLAASCRVDEKASVFFNLRDRGDGVATAFFAGETSGVANYKWDYANKSGNLDDGLYDLEIIARDPAGNESRRTIEAVRIDRTGPVIANALCQPFVLMNSGRDPYSTTLTFNLNENNDQEINRSGTYATKIKLFNQNTGELLQTWDNTDSPLKFNGAAYPKGAYKFQIIATDIYGNNSVSFAMVVKDGMGPTISFPESGPVSGTIAIRGTAMDPDWTNSRPFKGYRVYYKPGQGSWVKGEESQWETALIDVPTVNRAEGGPNFQGIRPLQGDSTLAYLYTNGLANGTYTVLVVVEEEGGESMGAVRTFTVANDPQATMSYLNNPAVRLGPLPNNFNFTGNNKLPINFVNSVKPANVYLEIIRVK